MNRIGLLPTSLTVNGTDYPINTDFRVCLNILQAMADPELDAWRKVYVCLYWFYDAFEAEPGAPLIMPPEDYDDAYKAACEFLDHGARSDGKNHPALMDWEQDADILFPAVNRAAGFETRSAEYIHWWTFLGWCMSVDSSSVWANVLSLRSKRARGKPLEKWEQEYWAANKAICVLRHRDTPEEKAQKEELKKLFV